MLTVDTSAFRGGSVAAATSKSVFLRQLLCAALGDRTVFVPCASSARDVLAAVRCLADLCADISPADGGYTVTPRAPASFAVLDPEESGSALRFLLPLCAALNCRAVFRLSPSLRRRPVAPLLAALRSHGADVREDGESISIAGQLTPGLFTLPGDISSQYISGLLFALPLLRADSRIVLCGRTVSEPYLKLTQSVLSSCGVRTERTDDGFFVPGNQRFSPTDFLPDGDWSCAAPILCMGARESVTVTGLCADSAQGDRAICDILRQYGADVRAENNAVCVKPGACRPLDLCADDIPDLIPPLAVLAASADGDSTFRRVGRLSGKESDRVAAICSLLSAFGAETDLDGEDLTVHGRAKLACTQRAAYPVPDHRMAMSAVLAAVLGGGSVTIDETCLQKSDPEFLSRCLPLGICEM